MNRAKNFFLEAAKTAREKKDTFILPLTKLLDFLNISPWQITFFSFILGLCAAASLQFSKNIFIALILAHFLLDGIDGPLARYKKIQSGRGWWIDYSSDRIVGLSIIVSTIFILKQNHYAIALLFLYVLNNALYLLRKKDYQIIHFEILLYYPLLYIDLNLGTIFYFWVSIANLFIIAIWFLVLNFKKVKNI